MSLKGGDEDTDPGGRPRGHRGSTRPSPCKAERAQEETTVPVPWPLAFWPLEINFCRQSHPLRSTSCGSPDGRTYSSTSVGGASQKKTPRVREEQRHLPGCHRSARLKGPTRYGLHSESATKARAPWRQSQPSTQPPRPAPPSASPRLSPHDPPPFHRHPVFRPALRAVSRSPAFLP